MIDWGVAVTAGLAPGSYAGLMIGSFVASFITVALGIGGGVLLLAIMASLVPGAALIPVHAVVQLGSNLSRAALLRRHIFAPALIWFFAGSLLGASIGGAIVVELPGAIIQAGIGAFVIWSVLFKPPRWLRRSPGLTGAISSFLTMFFGATGVFVANFTKSLSLDRFGHVATHATLMTMQHGLKILVFGVLGFAFGPWLGLIASLIVAGLAGTLAGKLVLGRITDANFKRALDVVLILLSLRLIWAGVTSA